MKITETQLTRFMYSMWDFQQALSALTFLLEDCDFDTKYNKADLRRFRCYETTLIVSFARPFEKARGVTTLSLKSIGIKLSPEEEGLKNKLMHLRRKIVAHSDEEEMHFRSSAFSVLDGEFMFPHLQFNEGLILERQELRQIELLLRRLKCEMAKFHFKIAQNEHCSLEIYKEPKSVADIKRNVAGSAPDKR